MVGSASKVLLWMGTRQRYSWWMVGDTSGNAPFDWVAAKNLPPGWIRRKDRGSVIYSCRRREKGVEEVRQEVTKVKVRGYEMKSMLVQVGHIIMWAVAKMPRCKDAKMPRG